MPKVEVEIPDEAVSAEVRVKIAQLEKDLKNALNRERRLKDKVKELEANEKTVKIILGRLENIADELVDDLDMSWRYL